MALQQAGIEWINEGLVVFINDANKGSAAIKNVGTAGDGAGQKMDAFGGIVQGIASTLTGAFLNAVGQAGNAVVGLTQDSIGMAQEFQVMASKLQIAGTGAVAAAGIELEDLSEIAMQVGGDTRLLGVSATGAADAMTGLLKAGMPLSDILGDVNGYMNEGAQLGGVLRASIDLAAATELDMVEASDLASITMTQFGLTAEETSQAMDYLVRSADASVASVPGIRDALINAGPAMKAFGFTIQDTSDAIALLSNTGMQGSEAGTALRSMFTAISGGSAKATAALDAHGISLTDDTGKYYEFKDILAQFQVAMDGMTEAERANFAQDVAGAYGKGALLALVGQGTEGYEKYANAVASANGITAQAEVQSQNLASQQEALDGNIESLKIRIGTAFLPVLSGMTTAFSGLVDTYGPTVVQVFTDIGAAIVPLSDYFFEAIGSGNLLNEKFATLPGPIQNIITRVEEFRLGVTQFIAEAQPKVESFVSNFMDGFNAVKDWVVENWPTIKAVVITSMIVIGSVVGAVIDALKPTIEELGKVFAKIDWEAIAWAAGEVAKILGGVLLVALAIVTGAINGIVLAFTVLIEDISKFATDVKNFWNALTSGDMKKMFAAYDSMLKNAFSIPLKFILNLVSGFVTGVYNFFNSLFEKLVGHSIIPEMMSIMQNIIDGILTSIQSFIGGWIAAILKFFSDMSSALQKTWDALWSAIETTVKTIVDSIKIVISNWITAIQKIWEDFKSSLQTTWDNLWSGIRDKVASIVAEIKLAIDNFLASLRSSWDTLSTDLQTKWNTMWAGIKTGMETAFAEIISAIGTWVQNILDNIQSRASELIQMGANIVEWLRDGLVNTWTVFITALTEKLSSIKAAIQEKVELLKDVGAEIVRKFKDGFIEFWNNPTGLLAGIKAKFASLKIDLAGAWDVVKGVGSEIVTKIKDGLMAAWNILTDGVVAKFEEGGILAAVVQASSNIVAAGSKLVEYMKQGVSNAWTAFVTWIKDKLIGWFNDHPTTPTTQGKYPAHPFNPSPSGAGIGSTISSQILESVTAGLNTILPAMQFQLGQTAMAGQQTMPSYSTYSADNSRTIQLEINPSYSQMQSPTDIYYDVSAALAAMT